MDTGRSRGACYKAMFKPHLGVLDLVLLSHLQRFESLEYCIT